MSPQLHSGAESGTSRHTFTSMPFSKRLSGSDFISQWLCSGGSAAFTLSLDFPVAFLFPPTEAETFPPSSALPGEERTATYNTAGRICYRLLDLLTCICSFFTHSGSFLWRHLFLTMKYSMNEFISPPTTCVAVVCYVSHSSCKLMQHNHFEHHIYVWL